MWNIGLAEIGVIVVIGLLIFGPDRLPKAVKSLTTGMRTLRAAATDATRNLQESAGWDDEDTRKTFNDLADLHPKRIVGSIMDDAKKPAKGTSTTLDGRATPAGTADSLKPAPAALSDFDPDTP